MDKKSKPSQLLEHVVQESVKQNKVSISEISQMLQHKAFGVLILLFSAPLILPVPTIPGVTAILGFPLLVLSLQFLLCYKSPVLPKFLSKRGITPSKLEFISRMSAPVLKKIEKLLHPRFTFFESRWYNVILGLSLTFSAFIIFLPIPGANWVPAISMFIISLGIVSEDGIAILIGIILGLVGLFACIGIILFGVKFINFMSHVFS